MIRSTAEKSTSLNYFEEHSLLIIPNYCLCLFPFLLISCTREICCKVISFSKSLREITGRDIIPSYFKKSNVGHNIRFISTKNKPTKIELTLKSLGMQSTTLF